MGAEEPLPDLETEVRGLNHVRGGRCAVCEWIEGRDDAAEWDRLMALPFEDIEHKALSEAMRKRGFTKSNHRVGVHRREHHRVA